MTPLKQHSLLKQQLIFQSKIFAFYGLMGQWLYQITDTLIYSIHTSGGMADSSFRQVEFFLKMAGKKTSITIGCGEHSFNQEHVLIQAPSSPLHGC